MRDRRLTAIDIIALSVHYDAAEILGDIFRMEVRSADEADKNQLLGYGHPPRPGRHPDSVDFWYYDVPEDKPVTIMLQLVSSASCC